MSQSQAGIVPVHWDVFDRLCADRGWTTAAEAAEKLGISAGHLSNMRAGRDGPGPKFIHACITEFGSAMYVALFGSKAAA